MSETIQILKDELPLAIWQTITMVGIATLFGLVLGGLLGLFLYLTSSELFFKNKWLNNISGMVVNVTRSFPYIILLIVLLPLSGIIVGTKIGTNAATVPLVIAAIAFFARLAEGAFSEVDKGVLEAAIASGAKFSLIFREVLLVEAKPGLIRAVTLTIISLIGYSAMAGTVGGGGIGDLAIRLGYHRYETGVMIAIVIVLIVIVQLIQLIGDKWAERATKR